MLILLELLNFSFAILFVQIKYIKILMFNIPIKNQTYIHFLLLNQAGINVKS